MSLVAGFGGATRNACVALFTNEQILGICEQERITRVRGAGFNSTGLPDEALDELLRRARRHRGDVATYAVAEPVQAGAGTGLTRLEHHFAHACSTFLPSPFQSATIIVCDHDAPHVSVWDGHGSELLRVEWPWSGPGFAEVYSLAAEAIGFVGVGREQRMEALARLNPAGHDDRAQQFFSLDVDRLQLADGWQARIAALAAMSGQDRISIAAGLQARLVGIGH